MRKGYYERPTCPGYAPPAHSFGREKNGISGMGVLALLLFFLLVAWTGPTRAMDTEEELPVSKTPTLSGTFLTFFLWKSDRDFDSTEPLFNEYGQSLGYVDVTVYPRLLWRPTKNVKFYYYAEIGNAFWSSTEADPLSQVAESKPVYVQRQLWVEILMPWEGYGLRAGFQYIYDPTLLFLEKDVGALHAFYQKEDTTVRFTALQVPDTAYEGFDFEKNNFENDNFMFAVDGMFSLGEDTTIRPGLFFQWDRTDVKRTRLLWNPCVNLAHDFGRAGTWELDAVLQAGTWKNRSINNQDMDLLAGAMQLHGAFSLNKASLEMNLLAFSPDDGNPHNGLDTGFQYSGFSRSRTLVLSQNWIFDQYDNLDEMAAASRAGLFLMDLYARLPLGKGFELFGVLGYGMVLEERYANRGQTLGTEIDVGLFWYPYTNTRLAALGGVLVPGKAGAAFRNEISLDATDPMYYFQGAIEVSF